MDGISVIICCYNSSSRLPQTLQNIADQKIASLFLWELIIIDNASTDNTRDVAGHECLKYKNLNYKIIEQPLRGLAKAREKGIEEAKYDLVLFCDDDNHLDLNYLERAYCLMKDKPEVGIAGGMAKPKLAYYPGRWIEDMYPGMAIGARALNDGEIDWVYGAGMVIRKKIFLELRKRNIKFLLSDRVADKQFSGGDSEFCELAKFLGYKVYYTSKLQFFHEMQAHRLKKFFFIKGNYKMVIPLIYLFILSELVAQKGDLDKDKLFRRFFIKKITDLFYYSPRMVFGKHQFYSFIMFYQALQMVIWLCLYRSRFNNEYLKIKKNLSL
jgi:glycosyltransferase involved in cell wall biosynthesis